MFNPGLSTADYRTYLSALTKSYRLRVTMDILDLNHYRVASLSGDFLEGSEVACDTGDPTTPARSFTGVFVDRTVGASWEPRSPGAVPLHRQYMASVRVSVYVTALSQWIAMPVFTGPLWDFQRSGAVCSVVAQGKERQLLGAAWSGARSFPRGIRKTTLIRQMAQVTGEQRLALPDLAMTMPQQTTVARGDSWWPKMRRVAASTNQNFWYDGEGWLQLKPYVMRPFLTIDPTWLTEEITVSRSVDTANTFEVIGSKPKGSKVPIRAVTYLPRPHPMSPWSLQRGGRPHYILETYENEDIKTQAEANALAARFADDRARAQVDQQVSCLPIWPIEDGDAIGVVSKMGSLMLRVNQYVLPLDGNAMTLGRTTELSSIEARAKRARAKAKRHRRIKGRTRHPSRVEDGPSKAVRIEGVRAESGIGSTGTNEIVVGG